MFYRCAILFIFVSNNRTSPFYSPSPEYPVARATQALTRCTCSAGACTAWAPALHVRRVCCWELHCCYTCWLL